MVQWLSPHFHYKGTGLIPGQGTRFHMLYVLAKVKKKTKTKNECTDGQGDSNVQ